VTKLQRLIWLALYLQRFRVITYESYCRFLGPISLRTYRRDIAELKSAGLRLDGNYHARVRGLFGTIRVSGTWFYGFDETAPARSVA